MSSANIDLDICTPEGKTWLARVIGVGGQYGIERSFINPVEKNTSRSGMTGTAHYVVTPGVYESNEGRKRYGRRYWLVAEDGTVTKVSRDEAIKELDR